MYLTRVSRNEKDPTLVVYPMESIDAIPFHVEDIVEPEVYEPKGPQGELIFVLVDDMELIIRRCAEHGKKPRKTAWKKGPFDPNILQYTTLCNLSIVMVLAIA
jgi:hypothetical protein